MNQSNNQIRSRGPRAVTRLRGSVKAEFDDKAEIIRLEYGVRSPRRRAKAQRQSFGLGEDANEKTPPAAPDPSAFESKEGYLMRECYLLIRMFSSRGGGPQAIKSLSGYGFRDERQPDYEDNKFYWGIKAVIPDFDTRDLRFWAEQLRYAEIHGVPPEYLVGFLLQSGTVEMLKHKTRNNVWDDGFIEFRIRAGRLRNLSPKTERDRH